MKTVTSCVRECVCYPSASQRHLPPGSLHKASAGRICIYFANQLNAKPMLQVALESVSATHQLVSAIHTLALCTRPLLLAGFAPNPESAESGPIDADEHKVPQL